MIKTFVATLLICIAVFAGNADTALAQQTNKSEQGLAIAPLREQVNLTAGTSKTGVFTIANHTSAPMKVDVLVETFSVKNTSYEYTFRAVDNEWVRIAGDTKIELRPNEERRVKYEIYVPAFAPSGGYYYTLLASMNVPGVVTSELRVASLLYVTVDGSGIVRSGEVYAATIPAITMTPQLAYTYTAKNTGNVHVMTTDFSQVKGLFTDRYTNGESSILMPKTDKVLSGSATLPWMPGMYDITYGYKNEHDDVVAHTAKILYIPLWLIIVAALMLVALFAAWRKRHYVHKAH